MTKKLLRAFLPFDHDIVKKRIRPGDIEVDFMMGKNHKVALLVMTDRATLQTNFHRLKNRHSGMVSKTNRRS